MAGRDYAIAVLYLQKRHQDADGNITAKRVGTMVVKYGKSTNGWVNDATYTIHYGDIRHMAGYDASLRWDFAITDYARNSKGKECAGKGNRMGWAFMRRLHIYPAVLFHPMVEPISVHRVIHCG